jgi:hypothetical protein
MIGSDAYQCHMLETEVSYIPEIVGRFHFSDKDDALDADAELAIRVVSWFFWIMHVGVDDESCTSVWELTIGYCHPDFERRAVVPWKRSMRSDGGVNENFYSREWKPIP